MKNPNNKLTIVLFRNYGIKHGRGYQSVYIYKYLEDIIYKMYLLRVHGKYKSSKIKALPMYLQFIMYLTNILLPKYFKINVFNRSLYDFFNEFLVKNINLNTKYYLFNYSPHEGLLKKLKKNNKELILYYGGMNPLYYYNIKKEELKKIGLIIDKKEYRLGINEYEFFKKYFKRVILMSDYSKDNWIKQGYEGSIYVNKLGVDFEYFNKLINEKQRINDKIFLFMGRIEVMKGVHYLLDAWEQLDLKDAKLWLVGQKKYREWKYFENRIKNMQNVEYLGYRTDLPDLYNKSLVFVFPSLSEGFGKVVLEAMASGLPIIGTPCVSEQFECGKEGFEINYRDVDGLKKYIQYFYDNPEKAIEMGYNAKLKAKTKTWDKFGENFRNVILNIIKGEVL